MPADNSLLQTKTQCTLKGGHAAISNHPIANHAQWLCKQGSVCLRNAPLPQPHHFRFIESQREEGPGEEHIPERDCSPACAAWTVCSATGRPWKCPPEGQSTQEVGWGRRQARACRSCSNRPVAEDSSSRSAAATDSQVGAVRSGGEQRETVRREEIRQRFSLY